jgi:drug/metabolite transporter (DMT)-like permease
MQAQKSAYLFTALTVLFWGGAASAFKLALTELSPFSLLAYATGLSFFFLLILLAAQGRLKELTRLSTKRVGQFPGPGADQPPLCTTWSSLRPMPSCRARSPWRSTMPGPWS